MSQKAVAIWRGGKVVGYKKTASRPKNYFEAAQPNQYRKHRTDRGSGDASMQRAGDRLRVQARHLEDNHDIATGILDILVDRTVGRGIRYEPQVLDTNGDLHEEFNEELLDFHTRWSEHPTTDGEYSRADMERLYARTLFRDGEGFKIYHMGNIPKLTHNTLVPLSLEPLEPDFCPMHFNQPENGIIQGIRKNAWGKPNLYHFYKYHPGDIRGLTTPADSYKAVSGNMVNHIKFVKRFHQTRGQSVFHAVLTRLDDLKDYEEAERIAARIAAKLVGYVRKGQPDMYDPESDEGREEQIFENGMVLYDMSPGEEVGLFDNTKRPNSGVNDFRAGQLKATAAGTGVSNSSASKSYDGTFSAQRQELVEQQEHYEVLQGYFIDHSCKPDYRHFVNMATLGGLRIPDNIKLRTLYDVACYGTSMPWIDPVKEAKANEVLLNNNLTSQSEIIRRRGGNPTVVYKQIERDRKRMEKWEKKEDNNARRDDGM